MSKAYLKALYTIYFVTILLSAEIVLAQAKIETTPQSASYTCEVDPKEPLRKVCTDRSVQTYLRENFQQIVGKNTELDGVECDWRKSITPQIGSFGPISGRSFVCEDTSQTHRLLVGWASAEKFLETLRNIGNEQLRLNGAETGRQDCKANGEHKKFANAIASTSCTMKTDTGKLIFSEIIFLQQPSEKNKRIFIAFMDTKSGSSGKDVSDFLYRAIAP